MQDGLPATAHQSSPLNEEKKSAKVKDASLAMHGLFVACVGDIDGLREASVI